MSNLNSVDTVKSSLGQCHRSQWWRCQCALSQSSSWGRCQKPPESSYWCRPSLHTAWQTLWNLSWPHLHFPSWWLCGSWHLLKVKISLKKLLPLSFGHFQRMLITHILNRRRPSPAGTNSRTICPSSSLRSSHLHIKKKKIELPINARRPKYVGWFPKAKEALNLKCESCLKQGNSMAMDSGWPSSLTSTLSRNQPQPPPRPSWPTRTRRTRPKDTDSMRNSSC